MSPIAQRPLLFLLALSILTLAAAYTAEYGFGLKPCILCLYQRIPYAVVIFLSLCALFVRHAAIARLILLLIALTFAASAGLAFYHVGVEMHWFEGFTSCGGQGPIPATLEELRAQLLGAMPIRCDKPAFMWLGLSMAGWNMLWSLLLCFYTIILLRRKTHA